MKSARIDWDQVRSRLRSSQHALEEVQTESPERIDAAYRLRAARLAKGRADLTLQAPARTVMVFRLGTERYAIPIEEVTEAVRVERCTPVPGSPSHFAGVVSLRGELHAVVDLVRLLDPAQQERHGEDEDKEPIQVLLLRGRGAAIGLKVDRIDGLREVRPEELSLPSEGKYVTGLAQGALRLLSMEAVLAEVYSTERIR